MEYPLRERGDYFPSGKGGFLVGWVQGGSLCIFFSFS